MKLLPSLTQFLCFTAMAGVSLHAESSSGSSHIRTTTRALADLDHDRTLESVTEIFGSAVDTPQRGRWTDIDADGDLDLFLIRKDADNALYRNDHDELVPITDSALRSNRSLGMAWGDYDNDRDLDVLLLNETAPNQLYRNQGDGTFEPVTADWMSQGAHACWGDYNNDGRLDLYISSAHDADALWLNQGEGAFEKTWLPSGTTISRTANWVDVDDDGDLDFTLINQDGTPSTHENLLKDTNWLFVDLIGRKSNPEAIGAKVHVLAEIDGEELWQMREFNTSDGNDPRAHFGLGNADCAKIVRIEWPSGIVDQMRHVAVNQFCTIPETVGPPTMAVRRQEDRVNIAIDANPDLPYRLEASTDLEKWLPIDILSTNAAGRAQLTLPADKAACYYRIHPTQR